MRSAVSAEFDSLVKVLDLANVIIHDVEGNRFAPDQPFDAELGIKAASFGEGGLRVVYITFQRVGGG